MLLEAWSCYKVAKKKKKSGYSVSAWSGEPVQLLVMADKQLGKDPVWIRVSLTCLGTLILKSHQGTD